MLKCPAKIQFNLSISKEDIKFGMASAYWLSSFGNKKDTPVNLGEGYEPVLYIQKNCVVYNKIFTFDKKENHM